jgi:hypothetical protein
MHYKYTKVSHFDTVCNYMYTPYLGVEFINLYFKNRLKYIRYFKLLGDQVYKHEADKYFYAASIELLKTLLNKESPVLADEALTGLSMINEVDNVSAKESIKEILFFSIEREVVTEDLILFLLFNNINNKNSNLIKDWVDRLVQKFEVTKKLYEIYQPGFRKGKGLSNVVRLYYLFALLLVFYYSSVKNLKYLNALLKITDLLCSISNVKIENKFPLHGLSVILLIEALSVRALSSNIKGVCFDFK